MAIFESAFHNSINKQQKLRINVGGTMFSISEHLVHQHPGTRLAKLTVNDDSYDHENQYHYFDRNPDMFNLVLDYYRYGYIHSKGLCCYILHKELEFWGLDHLNSRVTDCCNKLFGYDAELEHEFKNYDIEILPPKEGFQSRWRRFYYGAWSFLNHPTSPHTPFPKLAVAFAVICILTNTVFMINYALILNRDLVKAVNLNISALEGKYISDRLAYTSNLYKKEVPVQYHYYELTDKILLLLLGLECLLRYIIFVYNYCIVLRSPVRILEILVTIAAFILTMLEGQSENGFIIQWVVLICYTMQAFRPCRIFLYISMLDCLLVLILTIRASIKELLLLFTLLAIGMFMFAAVALASEALQPLDAGVTSLPQGFWWSLITMTTVGYGDVVPASTGGKVIGIFCALSGLVFTALPVAVIGSNFSVYWTYNKVRKARKTETSQLHRNVSSTPSPSTIKCECLKS